MPDALDLATLALRLTAGAIFLVQGYVKLARPPDVPHGRSNLEGLMRVRGVPSPHEFAFVVAAFELVGGAALIAGLLTRIATIPLGFILLVAIVGFKFRAGFLGGWDWPLSVLTILIAIALLGPGTYSIDAILGAR